MSASVNIKLTRRGVEKYASATTTIADIEESADLMKAASLYVRMLHEGVWEYFADEDRPPLEAPNVLVPSIVDGLDDVPRRIQIRVGNGPRDANEDTPEWFVSGVRKMFPDYDWKGLNELVDQKLLDDLRRQYPGGKNEFDEDVPAFSFVSDGHDLTAETAVMLFYEAAGRNVMDHSGFVGVGDKEILVSEPYGVTLEEIARLAELLKMADWTFRILGVSAHYPSATIRIEIQPK
jgi:hypothetical protein